MEIEVGEQREGQRLDIILAQEGQMSRRAARRLIESGCVFVDAKRMRVQSRLLDRGAIIKWSGEHHVAPTEAIPIVHRGHEFVVANKPAGMPTEPTRQGSVGTLTESIRKAMRMESTAAPTVAAVHRLDSDTSGVVIVATSKECAGSLGEPFRSGEVQRRYIALVHGEVDDVMMRIDAPIGKARDVGRMMVDPTGKASRTLVTTLAVGVGATLVSVVPLTGRTHQIRVHLAHVGHPIVGDIRYAAHIFAAAEARSSDAALPFCLHALALTLMDPRTSTTLRVSAPPPRAFLDACDNAEIPRAVSRFAARAPWDLGVANPAKAARRTSLAASSGASVAASPSGSDSSVELGQ